MKFLSILCILCLLILNIVNGSRGYRGGKRRKSVLLKVVKSHNNDYDVDYGNVYGV